MSVSSGPKTCSPLEAFAQWWREWTAAGSRSELKYCTEEEVARMAQEAGVSAGEFRTLASKGPEFGRALAAADGGT